MKLYALKTTDTKEWVTRHSPHFAHAIIAHPEPVPIKHEAHRVEAERDLNQPCEWVEVRVIEANHLPDAGNVMNILDAVDKQREQAAIKFVRNGNVTHDHWSFKQGAKWAIEAIEYALNHIPDAGNKIEPSGDSGELAAMILNETIVDKPFTYSLIIEAMHRYGREAFEAGWNACESHFDPFSEIGGAPLQIAADYKEWKTKNQTK